MGATAVGKTTFSIQMAKSLDTVVLSADSRQFFREMNIGTAKPSREEMEGVPHYFVDNRSIEEEYNAGMFEKEALATLSMVFKERSIAIMTGGSGLYVNALCDGIDEMPKVDPEIRKVLNHRLSTEGMDTLREELLRRDPEYFAIVDRHNPQRIIRALEVCQGTGRPYSSFRKKKDVKRPFEVLKLGLEVPREELYTRIDNRMDIMITKGLFEEAETLYPFKHKNALQTVGYKEIHDYMDGQYDRAEAIRLLKRNSRRYAKRQMTWFKKDLGTHWLHPEALDSALTLVKERKRD